MTPTSLKSYTLKDLAQLAKKNRVAGWQSMKKDQLVRALLQVSKSKPSTKAAGTSRNTASRRGATSAPATRRTTRKAATARKGTRVRSTQVIKRIEQAKAKLEQGKNLAAGTETVGDARDRLVVMVRGPYWLHTNWEISAASVSRAKVALGQEWHLAKPILRVVALSEGGMATSSERVVRDLAIHGGVRDWYIDVLDPPQT